MDDLLSSLLASSGQQPEDEESTSDPLAGFMDSLASGGMPTGAQGAGEMDDPLADLASGLPAGGQGMGGLLGALMGGGAPTGGQESGDMGGLLGALMGGGAPTGSQGAGDMGGLLGALMGGGQASSSAASPLTSIVTGLAEKMGISPQIAQLVVGFVLNKLLAGSRGGAQTASRSAGGEVANPGMDDILAQLNSGQNIDARFLESTGLTAELSQQTGLDPNMAAASLQKVLGMLSGKTG